MKKKWKHKGKKNIYIGIVLLILFLSIFHVDWDLNKEVGQAQINISLREGGSRKWLWNVIQDILKEYFPGFGVKEGNYKVVRVVDGDTIVVEKGDIKEKVRLIGIDTPESVHPDSDKNTEEGEIASAYVKDLLTDKEVSLELDVEERDRYGRLLAYVYVDDFMVNKHLLKIGYAKMATYPPNVRYVEEFEKLAKKAKEDKKGFYQRKTYK